MVTLVPDSTGRELWSAVAQYAWYDLVFTIDGDADFRIQVAGRIENGRDGVSDPKFGDAR